jgi:hypothetical protein
VPRQSHSVEGGSFSVLSESASAQPAGKAPRRNVGIP